MKNLFIIAALIVGISFGAKAQNGAKNLISSNALALIPTIDTVTNTGVVNMTLPVANFIKGAHQTVTVSVVVTKISGTGAGTVVLQGSTDGVNYETVAASQLQGAQTASYTITNVASQVHHFIVASSPYLFYRTQTTGSGTEVVSVKGTVYPN